MEVDSPWRSRTVIAVAATGALVAAATLTVLLARRTGTSAGAKARSMKRNRTMVKGVAGAGETTADLSSMSRGARQEVELRAMKAAAEAERMELLAELAMEVSVLDEDEAILLLFKVRAYCEC